MLSQLEKQARGREDYDLFKLGQSLSDIHVMEIFSTKTMATSRMDLTLGYLDVQANTERLRKYLHTERLTYSRWTDETQSSSGHLMLE